MTLQFVAPLYQVLHKILIIFELQPVLNADFILPEIGLDGI